MLSVSTESNKGKLHLPNLRVGNLSKLAKNIRHTFGPVEICLALYEKVIAP